MSNTDVHAMLIVNYLGTTITKQVTIRDDQASNATKVNRAIEHLTKKVQMMVQSEQNVQ